MEKLLLVLDIDETLIHATMREDRGEPDFVVGGWGIHCRPYLADFLQYCCKNYHVAVWTAGGEDYAWEVMDAIWDATEFEFIWASNRCTRVFDSETFEYYPRKPLKKILKHGWNKDRILAIDDTPQKWERSYGNHICVDPYFARPDQANDDELVRLMKYIETIKHRPSMRDLEKRFWKNEV